MTQYEKLCKLIDRLEEVPGHPNMRRESGLRAFLEFIRESYVCKDGLMTEIREQLRNDPTLLRDALGDKRVLLVPKVWPIIVDNPTEIPSYAIKADVWYNLKDIGMPGYDPYIDTNGTFEWIGNPSFGKSDFLKAIFLPNDGAHFAPVVCEVPYIIEDPENMSPDRFERVEIKIKAPIKTNTFPVSIDLLDATATIERKIGCGNGWQIMKVDLSDDDGHFEWGPDADLMTPGGKRVIYKPNDLAYRPASALVKVIKEEMQNG